MSALEKHYTVQEIAKLWRWSERRVRDAFRDEPGIVKYGHPALLGRGHNHPRKREYFTLSIPESVAERVYQRYIEKKKPSIVRGPNVIEIA